MLSATYYPFSRCIDVSALKQLLLVFDGVTFIDPVTDDNWRAFLMEERISQEDPRFASYQDVHRELDGLREEGAIRVVEPSVILAGKADLISASALSDLSDPAWCRVASNPESYELPHQHNALDGSATWQIFKPKMPDVFVEALDGDDQLRRHLVECGDDKFAWTLSYEAGSAISLSFHLAAADELCLAPVTDSLMHHQLLLQKSMRDHYGAAAQGPSPLTERAISQIAHQTAFSLVGELLPGEMLAQVSLDEVLEFRREMAPHRDQLIGDLRTRFQQSKTALQPEHLQQLQTEARIALIQELKTFQNEVTSARDKLWPSLVSSLNTTLAAGGATAVAFNYFGGAGYALAGSIVASALSLLKGSLELKAEIAKAQRSASPSITYLSRVQSLAI
jgi:hypothetical protein